MTVVRARLLPALRVAFAVLTVAALAYQLHRTGKPANFFSFFTVESNLIAVVALLLAAARPRAARGPRLELLRGGAALYMGITGVVFALFLSGLQEELQTTIPWVDFVVHKLMPVVVVVDWLLDPPLRPLARRVAALWLLFPLAYVVYTLIRGAIVDWYPYPFLDAGALGYGGVLGRAVGLALGMAAASAAVLAVGNALSRRAARAPAPSAAR